MNTTMLVLEEIVKSYSASEGAVRVLNGLALTVRPAETVAIIGPSGSGKSTLLHLIGALDQPTAGRIRLGETDVTALAGDALAAYRAATVGFVFQDHHLLPQLTARENVLLPTVPAGTGAGAAARADALLARMGIAGRANAFPAQMSGGERQRAAVARALINNPAVLLCDEPTGNLDHDAGHAVVDLLLAVAAERGVMVLLVTHNPELAARCGRTLVLRGGKLEAG